MEFVRTHTILQMLKGYPNIQQFKLEPVEVYGSKVTEPEALDGIIAAALAYARLTEN